MSHAYQAVQWNDHKRRYDQILAAAIGLYLLAFVGLHLSLAPNALAPPQILIRACGTCALLLLHLVLCIGPLARLFPVTMAPLLYNRRHLGVTTFLVGLVHGLVSTVWYHGFGVVDPLTSLLTSNSNYGELAAFPFQPLGLAALAVLFLMAATSHDFWLKNLSPTTWKTIHMLVYPAYGLLVMHVALGALQSERSLLYPVLLAVGVASVVTVHLLAALQERRRDGRPEPTRQEDDVEWVDAAGIEDLEPDAAKVIVLAGGERIALVRHADGFSAVSNVCAHQGGPLGEGRVVDGCLTCPWHGYQYRPASGSSPPPYTEKLHTYRVRVDGARVLVDPRPLPPGADVAPARPDPQPAQASS